MGIDHHRSIRAGIVDDALDVMDFKRIYDTKESAKVEMKKYGETNDLPYEIHTHLRCPHEITDPRISPINGACRHMPDTWIFTSTHEILNPDSLDFAKKLQDLGDHVRVSIGFELNHDYVMTRIPEAKDALREIGLTWL